MRRKEFSVSEQAEIESFLAEMTYGFLATAGEDGWPHIKALNFVYLDDAVYFHGSLAGEKMKDLKTDNRATFSVAKEYSMIPSYLLDPKLACPATVFFKSVTVKGRAHVVEDLQEKARVFTAFMKKLQPEGGYEPIDPADPEYAASLRSVALVKIKVEDLSAKFKFGQNLKQETFGLVMAGLENRGETLDKETIALMEKFCPHHKKA
ncbi:pyridoxamine 5'-phosphate oxidase family protein [Effusibacillus lacus]|uniref:Flavin-nucleotide-binding protein n=1 Tax=Effusibacillus lacus TaxID=1348429 RepID=A0A292YJQ8_9BACL|nr:pyridoxamine 5'-phosphate oxidase family protein [Effusibacillus lacus]TCS68281.1 nitroimidazol reductase NimA-like FMN-containing flavoprotein (pyridoxamine 5'-phosphate oxidase superfamily) [Effusibacillus lacus]GAX90168.1 flavin-nucleotide-binding protein [Effusibacillus lacus]